MKKNYEIKIPKINLSYKFYCYDYNTIEENICCDSKELERFYEQLEKNQLNGKLDVTMICDEKPIFHVTRKLIKGVFVNN